MRRGGALDETATVEQTEHLESFRQVVALVSHVHRFDSGLPTHFHLFDDANRFAPFKWFNEGFAELMGSVSRETTCSRASHPRSTGRGCASAVG
jgi:hypothetical protein